MPFFLPSSDPATDGADADAGVKGDNPCRHSNQPQPDNPDTLCLYCSHMAVAVGAHCHHVASRYRGGLSQLSNITE